MTEKQNKALDLLTEIIVDEANRIKAVNESDEAEYDDPTIQARLIKAQDYAGVFDGMSNSLLMDIITESLRLNGITFRDKRCRKYLDDVIREDIKNFM